MNENLPDQPIILEPRFEVDDMEKLIPPIDVVRTLYHISQDQKVFEQFVETSGEFVPQEEIDRATDHKAAVRDAVINVITSDERGVELDPAFGREHFDELKKQLEVQMNYGQISMEDVLDIVEAEGMPPSGHIFLNVPITPSNNAQLDYIAARWPDFNRTKDATLVITTNEGITRIIRNSATSSSLALPSGILKIPNSELRANNGTVEFKVYLPGEELPEPLQKYIGGMK